MKCSNSRRRRRRWRVSWWCLVAVCLVFSLLGIRKSSNATKDQEVVKDTLPFLQTTKAVSSCDDDLQGAKVVLDRIQVAESSSKIKILCFILTHSGNHETNIQSIRKTWGPKCDKLVLASNQTDDSIGAVAMETKATWKQLWNKLQETVHYIYQEYSDYDWYLKVDDDSYVILENLKEFLVGTDHPTEQPQIYGRMLGVALPKLKDTLKNKETYQRLRIQWQKQGHASFVFPSGGAGYVMNRAYLELLVQGSKAMDWHGTPPEDVAQMAVASLQQRNTTTPLSSTRDGLRRECFHVLPPHDMYRLPKHLKWIETVHAATGGIVERTECCSSSTISFHQVTRIPGYMEYMHQQLYECRR